MSSTLAAPPVETISLAAESLKTASEVRYSLIHLSTMMDAGFKNLSKVALLGVLTAVVCGSTAFETLQLIFSFLLV